MLLPFHGDAVSNAVVTGRRCMVEVEIQRRTCSGPSSPHAGKLVMRSLPTLTMHPAVSRLPDRSDETLLARRFVTYRIISNPVS